MKYFATICESPSHYQKIMGISNFAENPEGYITTRGIRWADIKEKGLRFEKEDGCDALSGKQSHALFQFKLLSFS